MTNAQLEAVQRMVAIRLSTHQPPTGLSWREWTDRLSRRLATLQMYAHYGERPSFNSALNLAADVAALLVELDAADAVDPVAGEAA